MKYRFVLLKDLPGFKAGSKFPLYRVRKCLNETYYDIGLPDKGYVEKKSIVDILDDPEWFRKEIDEDRLIDLKCPKCTGTHVFLYSDEIYNLNKERDGFSRAGCIESALAFQCVNCGHKRIIYGSGRALQQIEDQMEEETP